jgi:hypothetical protein
MIAYPVDISRIDESIEHYDEVVKLRKQAEEYLLGYEWCKEIYKGWLFTNIGFVACIFLFEIENTASPEDKLIWVLVGDFPTVYLDTYHIYTTKEVIETYIELAIDWLEMVEQGKSPDDCFPFDVPPGDEYVKLFNEKVKNLNKIILPHIEELSYKLVL